MAHQHGTITATFFGSPYLRTLALLQQLSYYSLIDRVNLVAMTAASEKIRMLSSLSLLWWGPWWQVTEVQLPYWQSLALELLLSLHLRLLLLLL